MMSNPFFEFHFRVIGFETGADQSFATEDLDHRDL